MILGLHSIYNHLHPNFYGMFINTLSWINGLLINTKLAKNSLEYGKLYTQMGFILRDLEFLRPDTKLENCWRIMKPIFEIPNLDN